MKWSKTAPKGTKTSKVASTMMMGQPHIMANPKKMKVADLATRYVGTYGFDKLNVAIDMDKQRIVILAQHGKLWMDLDK
jgi:hypothetical protein